ncbi:arylsulfatase [Limnoglobus roseus]|uniref:Arylsulfatase n=1 Tax=Limnoglobus roseus TaxID=2598579 RepID=A0A5C1A9Z6_9BACT|nr:arylsulfatase [Limnoglobus roseus]QEL13944.1 arylsulfatase [Limnoglobus roseus]
MGERVRGLLYQLAAVAGLAIFVPIAMAEPRKPNVVFILADDLGYGDIGPYGQKKIRTPVLDQLAADGVKFTQAYAGDTVCAPSRCALMTGLHTGHCRVRGNGGGPTGGNVALTAGDLTSAEVLKKAGYATALVGKWGLGEEGSTGVPTKKGFDHFYGYLNQTHAHNYYPDYLIRNEYREPIPANVQNEKAKGVAAKPTTYAPDLLLKDALGFIDANKERPFFLCYTTIVPHANNEKTRLDKNGNEVPSDEPYTNEAWPQPEKNKAAMITRLDRDIGTILKKLADLKLVENTIVIFSSDNGPHKEGGNDPAFFASSGPFRGIKRAMADGGIRVPFIVRWPGVVKPGRTADDVIAFWDFLPTVAEIAGQPIPAGLDGHSVLPAITGKGEQKVHEFLYWEFHEGGTKQAVRHGNWKAIRTAPGAKLQLFDVVRDPGEAKDVAAENPAVAAKIEEYLKTARTESKEFPIVQPKK